jgi:adenosylcobinamide-phosphate synthase
MLLNSVFVVLAYLIDRIIGDPKSIPHPVIFIGHGISKLEKLIRKFFIKEVSLKAAGLIFPVIIVGGSFTIVYYLLFTLEHVHPWLAIAAEIWLISTTVATKGLKDAALEIYHYMKAGNLEKAPTALGMIVGRDTNKLDETEISRGTVETVAENIVDAIISPLFYAIIGGAPLAMAYRAVNTLDSMVGYKNEKYKNLGWASARLDDVMNFLPARITGILIVLASFLLKLNMKSAWKMMKRDARLHPSPNSGFPESAVAGALSVQLGGTNYYQGIPSHRAKMGDPIRSLQSNDIISCVKIMEVTSILFIALQFIVSVMLVYI